MKPTERDDLLIRLDVRTENIEKITEKQEKHLAHLNSKVIENRLNIDRNHNRVSVLEQIAQNGTPLRLSRKQVATGGASVVGLATVVVMAIGKISGWW